MRTIIKMKIHNPPCAGEVLKELYLEPLDPSVARAAEALGIRRKTLFAILNGRAGISPEMALRLSKAFGALPESWLNQQMHFDLWATEKQVGALDVERLPAAPLIPEVRRHSKPDAGF
jgi:addiction module HigA family antidote